jgi:putative transposase
MAKSSPFRYCKTIPEMLRMAAMMSVRLTLSLRRVDYLLHERGIDISPETVRTPVEYCTT